ncbi:MAG: riboflavin synthase [Synergistaceae bacterium]|jgi:riboflavin synthase|nr:riboflavin synthase [Synergistaceae bacterium]
MFTGLIECVGRIRSLTHDTGDVYRVCIDAPEIAQEIVPGESVAVSGACLTATVSEGDAFYAQIMGETLRATRLGELRAGAAVNLERAMRIGGRFDGHMVLGHVDEVGAVTRMEDNIGSKKLWISVTEDISWGIAPKGSVAIDGVSLTVIDAARKEFSVGLIPTTLGATTIGTLTPRSRVNIEIDIMARYVARMLLKKNTQNSADALTWEKLHEYGW